MKTYISTISLLCLISSLLAQREVTISDMNANGDAVIELQGDNSNSPTYKEMILGFNQSNDGWLRMNTDHDLSFWTNNTRRMTVDKSGFIGIGTSAPIETLDVRGAVNIQGELNQTGSGNTTIESSAGTITIKTAGALVTIDETGNIIIEAAKNLSINAQGDISMSANNISMSALSNIDLTAGSNITQTAEDDINLTSDIGLNLQTTSYDLQTMNLSTNTIINSSHVVSGSYSLSSSQYTLNTNGLIKLTGQQINLNNGSLGAARLTDSIEGSLSGGSVTGLINSASGTVLIGN